MTSVAYSDVMASVLRTTAAQLVFVHIDPRTRCLGFFDAGGPYLTRKTALDFVGLCEIGGSQTATLNEA